VNPFNLEGKVAIVTGSSRGIGRSIAEQLAAAGAKVVVSSRKAPACEEVVAAIRKNGGEAIALPAHIGDKSQLEALVAGTRKAWGKIDILVCNAASNPYYGPMAGLQDDAFDKILKNNIVANHWLANLVLPEMAQRKDGAVIIVSSIGGLVNCIAPGLVKTDFAKALWENPEILRHYESQTPLRRIGQPDDIGGVAVFLASPAAAFITGQTIVADGGVTIAG
jgi:NAD(P)-dependent dehydrogenase (short-subunit alcohol dehydrogenase family)